MRSCRFVLATAMLALVSVQAPAQTANSLPIDMTGAGVTSIGSDKIRIRRVEANGGRYDVDLQWNPYDLRFDIASVEVHASTVTCTTSTITSDELDGYMIIEAVNNSGIGPNPDALLVKFVSQRDGGFLGALRGSYYYDGNKFKGLIQAGKQLSVTGDDSALNSMTALIRSGEANWNGYSGIPKGVTRTAQISKLPSWFQLGLPVQSIIWWNYSQGERTYNCQ